jgi:GxxExxY protein
MALITSPVATKVIGCAMRVHTALGPGLLESPYQEFVAVEFDKTGLAFKRHVRLSVEYQGRRVPRAYVADFIVENEVLLELKAVDHVLPVHKAQVLTYLRLAKLQKGLLINFRVARLKDGIKSIILTS